MLVLGHERMLVRATGRIIEASWAQVWTFREGVIIRYREYTDSAAWEAAYAYAGSIENPTVREGSNERSAKSNNGEAILRARQ